MIQKIVYLESIYGRPHTHIAFALNTNGEYVDDHGYIEKDVLESFASFLVRSKILPELEHCLKNLGEVITIKKSDKIYHGLVCYESNDPLRTKSISALKECLEKIDCDNSVLSTVIGDELTSAEKNNSLPIMQFLHSSQMPMVVYNAVINPDPLYPFHVFQDLLGIPVE